jgi:hypothetical protein
MPITVDHLMVLGVIMVFWMGFIGMLVLSDIDDVKKLLLDQR